MWTVYDKTGTVERCKIRKLEYSGSWMGERFVSATIKSPIPVTFEIGDHFTYRNEVFTLNYDPSVIKRATVNSIGDSFTYESVKFNSFSDELVRCEFLDYILNDNGLHFSSLPTFSFYASSIQDLADRIQANLNRIYTSGKAWTVIVHPEYVNTKNINISVSKITVWGALELVKSQFNANFTIKGRTIVIGTAGAIIDNVFQYGKGNGLVKIQRVTQSDQQIITRLRVYGSQRNLPPLYYATMVNPIVNAPVLNAEYGWDGTGSRYSVNITFDFVMKFKGTTAIPVTIGGKAYSMLPHPNFQGIGLMYFSSSQEMRDAVYNGVVIVITSGIDTDNVPLKYKTPSGSLVPNNMAVQNLMLPSFPIDTIDPYLDSANIGELGIMEGSIFFDGSDSAKDEIFPSMEGITAQQLIDAGIPVTVDPGDNGNLDEISGGSTNIDGTPITDNGVYLDGENVPSFKIILKDIGFNLWDYRTSESPMISMKDGMCGGRDFEVKSCEKYGNKYILTCNRVYEDSVMLYYPYSDFKISSGDKFVLLNINMPDVYIKAASQRLLKAGQEYLKLNDYVRYTYQMNISQVYMARRPDLFESLVEGDLMLFTDNDLMIDGSITINTLRIVEGEDIKPSFEVTLTEDKQVGTLQKIQNQIDSIANGTQSGGGYNMQQISQMIRTVGSRIFLRRDIEDFTKYIFTFFKGLKIGDFISGMIGGRGAAITIDPNNKTEFEVDRIKVRDELIVPKITFNCIDVISGDKANTFAFGSIKSVDTATRIAELDLLDGELGTLKSADICRGIFHNLEGGNKTDNSYDANGYLNYSGFSTSYFTPVEILVNEPSIMVFRYVLQSGTSIHPIKGMNFFAYGNFNDKSRQAITYENRYYTRRLKNVNTWVINPDKNIAMQDGLLEGLTINGVEMHGYGTYEENAYLIGPIIQFTPSQKEELKGQDAYSVILSTYEQAIVVDDDNNIIGGTVEELTVVTGDKTVVAGEATVVTSINKLTSRIQAFKGKTELFYSPTYEEGAYMVSLNPVGCVAVIENGIVKITEIIDVDNISVGITVNCEGNAIFEKVFKVTAVRNGQSPIVVDFTNGMINLACDASGNVVHGLPVTTNLMMFYGTEQLALSELTLSTVTGITMSADKATGIITISSVASSVPDTTEINVTATAIRKGITHTRTIVLSLNKIKPGANGENAVIYELHPSLSVIKKDKAGNPAVATISCRLLKFDGTASTVTSIPDGFTLQYSTDGGAFQYYTLESPINTSGIAQKVAFRLYDERGQFVVKVDEETIYVVQDGTDGQDGQNGSDGTSIIWKGEFASHPANPQNGWAYRNTTDKKSYVYQSGAWYQMTVDGTNGHNGTNGISIVWKGDSSTPPASPQVNWVYRDTDNGRVYIYNGTAWELMVVDGNDGTDGAKGADGNSVYITYHDGETTPTTPTGNGTTGGWHTNATSGSRWMSQKVAASASSGTWGNPIQIAGKDGINGADGINGKDANMLVSSLSQIGLTLTGHYEPEIFTVYHKSADGTAVNANIVCWGSDDGINYSVIDNAVDASSISIDVAIEVAKYYVIRTYTKRADQVSDFSEPFILSTSVNVVSDGEAGVAGGYYRKWDGFEIGKTYRNDDGVADLSKLEPEKVRYIDVILIKNSALQAGADVYIAKKFGGNNYWVGTNENDPRNEVFVGNESPHWIRANSMAPVFTNLIIANAALIDFGTIGAFIYQGDYMFSQHGVDGDGNDSTDYQYFNSPRYPFKFNNTSVWSTTPPSSTVINVMPMDYKLYITDMLSIDGEWVASPVGSFTPSFRVKILNTNTNFTIGSDYSLIYVYYEEGSAVTKTLVFTNTDETITLPDNYSNGRTSGFFIQTFNTGTFDDILTIELVPTNTFTPNYYVNGNTGDVYGASGTFTMRMKSLFRDIDLTSKSTRFDIDVDIKKNISYNILINTSKVGRSGQLPAASKDLLGMKVTIKLSTYVNTDGQRFTVYDKGGGTFHWRGQRYIDYVTIYPDGVLELECLPSYEPGSTSPSYAWFVMNAAEFKLIDFEVYKVLNSVWI